MRLYLVRHGEAEQASGDPDPPLSARGSEDVRRLAAFLGDGVRVVRVLHSGKRRARQTTELLGATLAPGIAAEEIAGLAPNDDTDAVARDIESWHEDTLIAGHLPYMGRLVACLVAGTEAGALVTYPPGAVVCLERAGGAGGAGWVICWALSPELLGPSAGP